MSGYRVCMIGADGTAAVTTPIPDDLPTAAALATAAGGEVVSAALVAALARGDATAGGVPATEFRKRLIPLRLRLLGAPPEVRAKWGVILPELDYFTVVHPTDSTVAPLIALAVADGLLTGDEATALAQGA